MRPATPADRPVIEEFLRARTPQAMFPLSNLARHGMEGGHPRAMSFWLNETDGALTDVLGSTDEGLILPVCPSARWTEAAVVLEGRPAIGAMGPDGVPRELLDALGLGRAARTTDTDEPQFLLDLADLVVPEGPGRLWPLERLDPATRLDWRRDYRLRTLNCPEAEATDAAAADIAAYLEEDSHRVLIDGETPLAMTGFNAVLPDIVQVGGVYTPPARRGRGHARRALALHLAEARARGVRQATLFAAGAAAARAYAALGFCRIGTWTMCMLKRPELIGG